MAVTTPTGAQVTIRNSQGQKPKVLRRILKTIVPKICMFDREDAAIENQLYAKHFELSFLCASTVAP